MCQIIVAWRIFQIWWNTIKVPPPQDVAEAIERHQQESLRAQPEQLPRQSVKRELSASPQKLSKRVKVEVRLTLLDFTVSIWPFFTFQSGFNDDFDVPDEVDTILASRILDNDLPEIEEIMSTGSKYLGPFLQDFIFINSLFVLVFGPLMRLSPPPCDKDYCFNLDDSEGVCDLFDVL